MFGLRIHYVPGPIKKWLKVPVWNMPGNEKTIYLTFDDGPVPGPTDFVLNTLKQYKAKATFFCVGDNIRKHPEQFQKIISEGHLPANHTYNHLRGWTSNNRAYIENTQKCQTIMRENGWNEARMLFRPPYGMITRSQIQLLKKHYAIIMWDVLSVDYDAAYDERFSLRKTIRYTRPGSIVVFHDSYKAEKNLKYVLPRYLEHFSQLGFDFKTL